MNNNSTNIEQSQLLLNKIIIEYISEKQKKEKWKWIFRFFIILSILLFTYHIFYLKENNNYRNKPHVGIIDIFGTILDSSETNAESFNLSMNNAYKSQGLKAILLRINSPGGSPVQANEIYETIQHYRNKYPNIKIYTICSDICTSAAYYIASGTDKIFANPSSIIGSIGVLYNGFGFVNIMNKLGIERRLYTAGEYKGLLDPFSKKSPNQIKILNDILKNIHKQFINKIEYNRGNKINIKNKKIIFSGLIWTGEQAKRIGLIDDFSTTNNIIYLLKIKNIINYTYKIHSEKLSTNLINCLTNQLLTALLDTKNIIIF